MAGQFQNNIQDLPSLNDLRYENIFKVYQQDQYYFYNISKTISFDGIFDEDIFKDKVITYFQPWPIISYEIYNTTYLWWLLLLTNNIKNPVRPLPAGTAIRYIKPEYVRPVVDEIKRQVQQ